jgi:hypothetical protein
MSNLSRYAVYFMPPEGDLADFGAAWLGWDGQTGRKVPQLDCPDLPEISKTPRKYGFHGTLKAPFRLAHAQSFEDLAAAVGDLARSTAPAQCDGLALTRMGRFFALTPKGDANGINRVAATCVERLDDFRAPASDAELARRRGAGLSVRQDAMLTRWGYPFVMEEFRFHMTLTGKIPKDRIEHTAALITGYLPPLPQPFVMGDICLVGERADGFFQLLHRYALSG